MTVPKKLKPTSKIQIRGGRTVTVAEAREILPREEGAAFAGARERAGLSQPEAARRLFVPLATLRGWEQGRRGIPLTAKGYAVVRWGADPRELGLTDVCPCCRQPWPKLGGPNGA